VNIDIVERKAVRVAMRRYTGPFGEPLGRWWRATMTPWLCDQGLIDCPRYGVALDNPAITPAEECRYDACVELPAGLSVSDATEMTIPGGRYAVTRFKGTGAEIGAAWDGFVRAALERDLEMDSDRPAFEHYPRGAPFDARTGVFACELCYPVAS
jgi:AraC family transcriptional regulator